MKSLPRQLSSQEPQSTVKILGGNASCDIYSHTTFKNLLTLQKAQRYKNVYDSYQRSEQKVHELEKRL